MILIPATYYLEALRDWASRVIRERYPHHIAISVDGRVRLEAWLDASHSNAWMLLDALSRAWNASTDLQKIGCCMTHSGNHLRITTSGEEPHTVQVASIPPATWRPRHALAWCVCKLLPGSSGWTVREVTS